MEGRGGGDAAVPLDYTAGDKQMLNAQMIESVTPESPIAHARLSFEVNNDTPKKKKQCNCKHSRCLKLYCECFASGTYCDGCNCNNCYNNAKNDAARKEAVEATLERNLNAFRPKIANSPHGKRDIKEEVGDGVVLAKHNKGCHCKKFGCLKKYCECFQANILCSDNCKCMDCKNYDGSHERQALFHGNHANNIAQMQVSANAAVTGAVGSYGFGSPPSAKKRKGQEPLGPASKQFHWLSQVQEVNRIKSPSFASMSSVPVAISGSPAVAYDQSKLNYRSLLADLIQPQDLTALCLVLVAMTTEAATTFADQTNTSEMPVTDDPREPNLAATIQAQRAPPDDKSNGIQAARELRVEDCASDGTGLPNVRPLSPGTLALMCDEQDTSFMAVASSLHQKPCRTPQLSDGVGVPDLYIEQERIVLAKLRDCLNRLISFGEIKETQCLGFARNVSDSQRNGTCGDGGNAKVPLQPSTIMSYPVATLSSVTPSVANHHSRGSLAEKKRGHAA